MPINFCLHSSARTVQEAVTRAQRAEQLGFEAIFFADSQMNNVDPYQAMALCAVNTKRRSARHSPETSPSGGGAAVMPAWSSNGVGETRDGRAACSILVITRCRHTCATRIDVRANRRSNCRLGCDRQAMCPMWKVECDLCRIRYLHFDSSAWSPLSPR